MVYDILYEPQAVKRLDKLRGAVYETIQEAIDELAINPRPPGAVALEYIVYRTRVGRWRIIYVVDDEERVVLVSRIRKRDERTYKNY